MIERISAGLDAMASEHEAYRESPEFTGLLTRHKRATLAFLRIVHASWLHSSRWLPLVNEQLVYAGVEDTAESVVSFLPLVEWGVHNVCRRECRFLLESTVKHLYVDQQLPDVRRHSRQDRIDYLNSEVRGLASSRYSAPTSTSASMLTLQLLWRCVPTDPR